MQILNPFAITVFPTNSIFKAWFFIYEHPSQFQDEDDSVRKIEEEDKYDALSHNELDSV
jgi:hypothetical protein